MGLRQRRYARTRLPQVKPEDDGDRALKRSQTAVGAAGISEGWGLGMVGFHHPADEDAVGASIHRLLQGAFEGSGGIWHQEEARQAWRPVLGFQGCGFGAGVAACENVGEWLVGLAQQIDAELGVDGYGFHRRTFAVHADEHQGRVCRDGGEGADRDAGPARWAICYHHGNARCGHRHRVHEALRGFRSDAAVGRVYGAGVVHMGNHP